MKRYLFPLLLLLVTLQAGAQPQTYPFATRDTCTLNMDFYAASSDSLSPCVIYVFGGGFYTGVRNSPFIAKLAGKLNAMGISVAAIDYRLGLKGVKRVGVFHYEPLRTAIDMAVEDCVSATRYLLDHALSLCIDTSKIMLMGSSAGAITSLQTDYNLCNRTRLTRSLPQDFRYAGVLAFAGAVFSNQGKVKYPVHPPAPTFFAHGTDDHVVPFGRIRLFRLGFFGSQTLANRFRKFGYPYRLVRFLGRDHEVASYCNTRFDEVEFFIRRYVFEAKPWQTDELRIR